MGARTWRGPRQKLSALVAATVAFALSVGVALADPITVIVPEPTGTIGQLAVEADPATNSGEAHFCFTGGPGGGPLGLGGQLAGDWYVTTALGFGTPARDSCKYSQERLPQVCTTKPCGADATPPETVIDSGPAGTVDTADISFAFHSSQPRATFECQLDAGDFERCTSPKAFQALGEGTHTFVVRALNKSDVADPTPASRTFTIQDAPPNTILDSGPQGTVSTSDVSFSFHGSDGAAGFECKLDTGPVESCTSPKDYSGLADSEHTFVVWARNSAGKRDASPAVRSFAIERPSPPGFAGFTGARGSPFASGSTQGNVTAYDAVASGDLNGDGKRDAVVANSQAGNVSVLIGDGQGRFSPAPGSPFPTGATTTNSVAIADFNGDGHFDVIAGHSADGVLVVMLGDGQGRLSPAPGSRTSAGTGTVISVEAGDLNADGRPDVVTGGSGGVTVLLGNGQGGLTVTSSSSQGGANANSVALSDFNGDGKRDVTATSGNGVNVLLGDGEGRLTAAPGSPYPAGVSNPTSVVSADFNGDGAPDAAAVGGNQVAVLSGDGQGRLSAVSGSPFATGTTGGTTIALASADFNGDGNRDVAGSGSNGTVQNMAVLFGDGQGRLSPAPGSPYGTGANNAYSLAAADFNGDDRRDLVAYNLNESVVSVVLNDPIPQTTIDSGPSGAVTSGDVSFGFRSSEQGSTFECSLDEGPWEACSSPKDYAGLPDGLHTFQVRASAFGQTDQTPASRTFTIATQGGNAFSTAPGSPFATTGVGPVAVAAADFNGDGKRDTALADYNGGEVSLLLGDGQGGLSSAGAPTPAGGLPVSLAAADFNRDGTPDVAVANYGTNNVSVLLGDGEGALSADGSPAAIGGTGGPLALVTGDFNGDGNADVVTGNNANPLNMSVLLGDGQGGLSPAPGSPYASGGNFAGISATTGSQPQALAAGDLNGDGNLDVVTANSGNRGVSVLLGDGHGRLSRAPDSPFSMGALNPYSVSTADFDGDGNRDVAVATNNAPSVSVLLGDGQGRLDPAPGSPFATGGNGAFSLTTADLDADGGSDVAVINQTSSNVSVLLGDGKGRFGAAPGSPYAAGPNSSPIAAADLTGDGKPDLVTASRTGNNVTVLLNGLGGP